MEYDQDSQACNYRNCKHTMKEHDGKKCKCRHRQYEISGIGFTPKYVMFFDKSEGIQDIDIINKKEII